MKRIILLSSLISLSVASGIYYELIPVFKSEAVYKKIKVEVPNKECSKILVKVTNSNRFVGRLLGTVIGAVIGNQIGSGSGRDIATFTAGMIGGDIGETITKDNEEYKIVEQCKTIYYVKTKSILIGYDNYFNYKGKILIKFDKNKIDAVKIKIVAP